jgi:hypothetical protein
MSQPTPGDVFVSAPLTNISFNYVADQSMAIADRMFPNVPVNIQGGIVWEWDLGYLLRNGMKPRAPNAESAGIGNRLNQKTYACVVEALHHDIPDQRRANETSPISSDREATIQLTQQAWQRREITLKARAFKTGVWTGISDGTGVAGTPTTNQIKQWDQAGSDPTNDVTTLSTNLQLATGIRPNSIAFGQQVWDKLKTNAAIIDRLKFFGTPGNPTVVTLEAVAALFGLKQILVSSVVQATSNEGAATLTTGFVVGKEFVLFYVPDAPGLDTPSAGYTFSWTGYLGASALGSRMKKFRMEPNSADRVEIEQAYDQNPMAPALGGYYSSVVA